MTEPSLELRDGAAGGGAANGTNGGAHLFPPVDVPGIVPAPSADAIIVPPVEAQPPKTREQTTASAPAAQAAVDATDLKVADIRKNRSDSRGEKIEFVFFRRKDYVIYRSGAKIFVHFSDDEEKARKQVADTADLLPLRGRLQYLMRDIHAPHAYHWQIAEAFRLGLEGQKDGAKSTLEGAIENILAKRVSRGRTWYILCAGAVAMAVTVVTALAAIWCPLFAASGEAASGMAYLLMATGSGAMGALLSTAIALRARAVATDGDLSSNLVDSCVRILIGVISAAALYLLLDSNLLEGVKLSMSALGQERLWQIALLAGFVAGFLERLVPELLENKLAAGIAK